MHYKMVFLILSFVLLFVTPIMGQEESSDSAEATHTARVIANRAIVYSDESMNIPIGYISSTRLITVGNPRKRNPELVPLIVYGRLAFIEIKNLHFEQDSLEKKSISTRAPKDHNIDLILAKPDEQLSANNSAYIDVHQFGAGKDSKNLFLNIDNIEKSNFTGVGLTLLHRKTFSNLIWGAGFEYNSLSTSNTALKLFLIRPILGYTIIRSPIFLIDIDAGLDLIPSTQLTISNNYVTEPNGFSFGPSFHGRMLFFPESRYHLFGTFSYRQYNVTRLEEIYNSEGKLLNGISKINGLGLALGVSLEL